MIMGSIAQAFTMPSFLGAWAAAILPCALAYIRQAYVFSLSYGLATAAIGGAVMFSSACPIHTPWVFTHSVLVLVYGLRLFAFLLWRQIGQDAGYGGPNGKLAKFDKTPRAKRTSMIISTAMFYALMCCPLIYHAQAGAAALVAPFGKKTSCGRSRPCWFWVSH
jgi:sulfite exporter TauE/SafE